MAKGALDDIARLKSLQVARREARTSAVVPKSQKLQEAKQAVESVSQRSITVADIRKASKLAKASSIAPIEREDGSRAYLADEEQIAKSVEDVRRKAVIKRAVIKQTAQSNKERQAKWRAANPDKNRQRARDGMRKKNG